MQYRGSGDNVVGDNVAGSFGCAVPELFGQFSLDFITPKRPQLCSVAVLGKILGGGGLAPHHLGGNNG